jgi:hypothetical protein
MALNVIKGSINVHVDGNEDNVEDSPKTPILYSVFSEERHRCGRNTV